MRTMREVTELLEKNAELKERMIELQKEIDRLDSLVNGLEDELKDTKDKAIEFERKSQEAIDIIDDVRIELQEFQRRW